MSRAASREKHTLDRVSSLQTLCEQAREWKEILARGKRSVRAPMLKPPRKALPQAPAPPRRAPKASSAPRPFAPSRFRRNHQAMSKPPQDADGNYPCAHKCGRVFGHAPAAVAHSKVPPASKSNIERLWKTIEAKRRGSLVDFNTGLQNETGGMATDFSLKFSEIL